MAYYLTIEKEKGKFTPLDITKSKYFTRTSNLKGTRCTLAEVDAFTMMFNDERELRGALYREGFVDIENAGKGLTIRILRNNKYWKVMYDLLYQKDLEYIASPEKLISLINNKLEMGDYRFTLKYANTFLNFYDCRSTAPEVREFTLSSIRDGKKSNHFNNLDENYDNPLTRMTKLLIYDYYQTPSGRVEYKNTVKYRNLHLILAFINYYNKKNIEEITELKEVENQTSLFESNVKTKKKKKQQIDGQINLFNE